MRNLLFLVAVGTGAATWFCWRHPLIWRWLSGHPLDGQYRTNATWLHPATKVLHPAGRVVRWHHLPRLYRAGIRTGVSLGVLAIALGLLYARTATLAALAAAAILSAAAGIWLAVAAVRRWKHRRTWVLPLHAALGHQLAIPPGQRPADWLDVSRDRQDVTIWLPASFTAAQRHKDAVITTATAKLALEAPVADWSGVAGPRPHVRLKASPAPPARVGLADVQAAIDAAADTYLVLGLGRAARAVGASLDDDSPHVMLSQGSGSGKSTTGRLIGSQMLHKGAVLMVWDYKRISQNWAKGLPGVAYCKTPAQIHAAALWLLAEIERRNEVADAAADWEGNVHANVGPRIIVLAEELNATMNRLRAYWRGIRESSDPDRSPAVEAIEDALFMGRQVRVNIVAVGQKMSVRASGSGEARENMGIRLLGRYTRSSWKMLVDDLPFIPSSNQPGRIQVITGNVAQETQVARLTAREARELAASGTVTPWPSPVPGMRTAAGVPDRPGIGNTGPDVGYVPGDMPLPGTLPPDAIRLSDAVALGIGDLSLHALKKARQRDPAFPKPIDHEGLAKLYDPDELATWADSRPRAGGRKEDHHV